jgi:selenocysteine lyase/cysteine desulfurase
VHALSQRATEAYDAAREAVGRFLNAADAAECIFTGGTTDGINLLASSFVRPRLRPGSNIVLTRMEHHANIVPWQLLQMQGAPLEMRVAEVDERGVLDVDHLLGLIDGDTVLVAFAHVSNALGTVNPARRIIEGAHARGAPVLLDAAQSAPHMAIDVQALGCDFLVLSGHKLYGHELLAYATARVLEVDGVRIVGTAPDKASVLSFLVDGVHPHDVGTFLDADGIAIRAGHHCAQPLMRHLGIPGTARASFSFYNTRTEADRLAAGLRKIVKFFAS